MRLQIVLSGRRCLSKHLRKTHGCWKVFPNVLKQNKCVIKQCEWIHGFFQNVPDWFATQQQLKIWHDEVDYDDDDDDDDDDKLNKGYKGYQKRKPQKAKKKE